MKKRTKLTIGALAVLAGALLLSSCTASFCSDCDKAHILYAFDYGVTDYYDTQVEGSLPLEGYTNIYFKTVRPTSTSSGIGKTDTDAAKAGIKLPTNNYYLQLDQLILLDSLKMSKGADVNTATVTFTDIVSALDEYGYIK